MTTSRSILIGVITALAILVGIWSAYVGITAGFALGGGGEPKIATTEPPPIDLSQPPATAPDPLPTDADDPTVEPSVTDPPRSPEEIGIDPTVVDYSEGNACRTSDDATIAGGYPAATCRFWKKSGGLLTGESLGTGTQRIACQRDLDIENPVYTAKQTNTWWMWTTSDDGTWDWFPATAVAEGASGQPINGVALCE